MPASSGLAVTDAEVSHHITGDPEFRGPNGQFNRFLFEQKIRNIGFTEARFVAEQRRRMIRRQLAGTIASGLNAPKALVEAANRYQNEERSVEYLLIDRAQAGEVPSPYARRACELFRATQRAGSAHRNSESW